jgi:hypothetical protein
MNWPTELIVGCVVFILVAHLLVLLSICRSASRADKTLSNLNVCHPTACVLGNAGEVNAQVQEPGPIGRFAVLANNTGTNFPPPTVPTKVRASGLNANGGGSISNPAPNPYSTSPAVIPHAQGAAQDFAL